VPVGSRRQLLVSASARRNLLRSQALAQPIRLAQRNLPASLLRHRLLRFRQSYSRPGRLPFITAQALALRRVSG
jgi:hypothetical protein